MKIEKTFVIEDLPSMALEVDPRRSMNFAASVGDNNPYYFDDEQPDQYVAPPMQVVSLTWPLAIGYYEELRRRGYETAIRRQVHYTEHIAWHRPIRPGETLHMMVRGVALQAHAAGTFGVLRFEAKNADGEPVFVEHSGAIFRAVRMGCENLGVDELPATPERAEAGEPVWTERLHIDPLTTYVYDGCADLHFPIHTSRQFAHKVGLPDPIVHGTCTLSLAVRELTNREAGGDPNRLRAVGCRFTGMVFPGTDISVRLTGTSENGDGRNLFFDVLTADRKKALSEGFLTIA